MDGLLQPSAASSGNEQPTTNRARRRGHRRAGGENCGYDASLGQRKRVAHIPTVGAEKREESGLKIFTNRKRRERQASLHLNCPGTWSHRWGPPHFCPHGTAS